MPWILGRVRVRRGCGHSCLVVGVATVLVAFAIAHVAEDFAYDIPERRFGFPTTPAAVLLGIGFAVHVALIALAARDDAAGYLGNLGAGVGWLLAAVLDHLGEVLFVSPYRAGFVSKFLEVGLMVSALALAWVSVQALRRQRAERDRDGRG